MPFCPSSRGDHPSRILRRGVPHIARHIALLRLWRDHEAIQVKRPTGEGATLMHHMQYSHPEHGHSWPKAVFFLAVMSAVALGAGAAPAQDAYPNKPVKIIVGMPAGTFTDL